MQGPLNTRMGDWSIYEAGRARKRNLALIIRASESGKFNLVGQVFFEWLGFLLLVLDGRVSMFEACWDPEDVLLLGWTFHQLWSNVIMEDQVSKFVNRQICQWDGSSYFKQKSEGDS